MPRIPEEQMLTIFIMAAAFLTTLIGVEVYRRQALRQGFKDVPNERSLHLVPTPRGGGIVVVIVCLSLYWINSFIRGSAITDISWSYSFSIILIGAISFYDDVKTIPVLRRMIMHACGAACIIWQYGYWDQIYLPLVGDIVIGWAGLPLTFLWIVWLVNAYNFMDGIDGMAALQAVSGGLTWYLAGLSVGSRTASCLGGLTAAAGLGFFVHNRSPARIFMGDVGSTFFGFTFAVLPLMAKPEAGPPSIFLPLAAILIMWFFTFDTLVTFGRRLSRRAKVWQAHREHFYQKLAAGGLGHHPVTLIYFLASVLVQVFLIAGLAGNLSFLAAALGAALIVSILLMFLTKNVKILLRLINLFTIL